MKRIRLPNRRQPLNILEPPQHVHPQAIPVLWNGVATITRSNHPPVQLRVSLLWENGPQMVWDGLRHQIGTGSAESTMGRLTAPGIVVTSSAGRATCTRVVMPTIACKSVDFHLINAKNLSGGRFTVGNYLVSIVQTLAPSDRATIFTHLGRIERQDGANIQVDQPEYSRIIAALTWTLTFAAGGLITPAILRGYDTHDRVIWADYSAIRLIQRPPMEYNWINPQTPNVSQLFQEVLSGFHTLLNDPIWQRALELTVDFYANAHNPEIVSAARLILLQAGLEKLVETWYNSPSGQASPRSAGSGFGDRLERMLEWASVPTNVPTELPELAQYASLGAVIGNPNMNGPRIIAFVRNKFTHTPSPHLPPLTPKHEAQA